MADQDFNIKVVTTADTTGLKQTTAGVEQLDRAVKAAADRMGISYAEAQKKFAAVAGPPPIAPIAGATDGGTGFGLTGTALGLGTIVTVLHRTISMLREFNEEQNRMVDGMIKAQEKSRELGLSVADMLDAMKSAERIETEPLQVSFDRLKQKVTELKTEMKLAFEAGQYEDVKRLAAALGVVESQVHRVTSALKQQADAAKKASEEAEKAAEKRARGEESFLSGAVKTSSPQVQAALAQEEAARRASAAGDERSADMFRKSSEAFQRGMSPGQADEFAQLKQAMDKMNVTLGMILDQWK